MIDEKKVWALSGFIDVLSKLHYIFTYQLIFNIKKLNIAPLITKHP